MARGERVAVVGGVRTPFVRAGAQFSRLSFQDLGVHVLKSIVPRLKVDPQTIDSFVFGSVLMDPRTPNWAREIVFAAGLPKTIYAEAISNNCISGLVAITRTANDITLGKLHLGLAGGAESMSNPAIVFSREGSALFLQLARARTSGEKLKIISQLRLRHFLPKPPGITEPSTGLSMGQHMEITAKELKISRQSQDEIALRSHQNGAQATADGRLTAEIEPLLGISADTIIRKDTSAEKLAKLPPVFDRSPAGTLTAGNSSPLTDGASVVALMSESRATSEGREILAFITDFEYSAIDPHAGLLMAPAVAVPKLLKRNNLRLEDFDLIEIHEAFGAQVEANIWAWENGWREPAIGKVDRSKLNVLGGSIALGHPFAATGGRIVLSLANEMRRRNAKRGLVSICAAGAMAGTLILERS